MECAVLSSRMGMECAVLSSHMGMQDREEADVPEQGDHEDQGRGSSLSLSLSLSLMHLAPPLFFASLSLALPPCLPPSLPSSLPPALLAPLRPRCAHLLRAK
eukprot:608340-Rhodomonas_salina.1